MTAPVRPLPFHLCAQRGRVLIPVGERCPLGCTYCYTTFEGFRAHPWTVPEVVDEIRRVRERCRIRTFQVGYDGDPLASWPRGRGLLEALVPMAANLNLQTKCRPTGEQLGVLRELARRLAEDRRVLSVLVSICSWESAVRLEPLAPPPAERIAAIADLAAAGIPAFLALRPMVPGVSGGEISRILAAAQGSGARGVIPGPLYIHATWPDSARFLEVSRTDPLWRTLGTQPVSPPWDPQGNRWLRITSRRASAAVQEEAGRLGLCLHWSSARAMDALEDAP